MRLDNDGLYKTANTVYKVKIETCKNIQMYRAYNVKQKQRDMKLTKVINRRP